MISNSCRCSYCYQPEAALKVVASLLQLLLLLLLLLVVVVVMLLFVCLFVCF